MVLCDKCKTNAEHTLLVVGEDYKLRNLKEPCQKCGKVYQTIGNRYPICMVCALRMKVCAECRKPLNPTEIYKFKKYADSLPRMEEYLATGTINLKRKNNN